MLVKRSLLFRSEEVIDWQNKQLSVEETNRIKSGNSSKLMTQNRIAHFEDRYVTEMIPLRFTKTNIKSANCPKFAQFPSVHKNSESFPFMFWNLRLYVDCAVYNFIKLQNERNTNRDVLAKKSKKNIDRAVSLKFIIVSRLFLYRIGVGNLLCIKVK